MRTAKCMHIGGAFIFTYLDALLLEIFLTSKTARDRNHYRRTDRTLRNRWQERSSAALSRWKLVLCRRNTHTRGNIRANHALIEPLTHDTTYSIHARINDAMRPPAGSSAWLYTCLRVVCTKSSCSSPAPHPDSKCIPSSYRPPRR